MSDKKKKSRQGFTLIEILIYITVIGGALVGFVTFSVSIANSRNKTYVVQEVQANARTSLELISQRIHAATGVNTGSSTFDSDPGVLSLSMADGAKNPTIISLTADNGRLQIREGVSGAVSITSDEVKVTNLVFTNLTPSGERANIRIAMTTEFNTDGSDIGYTYSQSTQTSVSVRQ